MERICEITINFPTGSIMCISGCVADSIFLHELHFPHGSISIRFKVELSEKLWLWQLQSIANVIAAFFLPVPSIPDINMALGIILCRKKFCKI